MELESPGKSCLISVPDEMLVGFFSLKKGHQHPRLHCTHHPCYAVETWQQCQPYNIQNPILRIDFIHSRNLSATELFNSCSCFSLNDEWTYLYILQLCLPIEICVSRLKEILNAFISLPNYSLIEISHHRCHFSLLLCQMLI